MSGGRILVVVLAFLLLGGCSGDSDDDRESAPPTSSAVEEPTTSATTGTETEGAEDTVPPGRGGPLSLRQFVTGLEAPVHATVAPGEPDRLYVVEQIGRIRIVENGRLLPAPFLDLGGEIVYGGEQGLLSLAFHPEYETNRLFYVNFTGLQGETRVREYRADRPQPVATRLVLLVPQPYENHNGGQLVFGPDGLLYVGMGDGGSGGDPENRAQELSSRLGKLLRLDVDTPDSEWEMVGLGLRNPWRFSFDRMTGDLWIGDVGQSAIEEVDFVPADEVGELHNFGWDVFEGTEPFEDKPLTPSGTVVEPITEYTHDDGSCSITGGFVYRGELVRRQAWARYFYGDYCSGKIWSVAREGRRVSRRGHPFEVPDLTSFAEDIDGELYLLSGRGTIYQLVPRR
jgi:glucose/arabinose dehydrogenase